MSSVRHHPYCKDVFFLSILLLFYSIENIVLCVTAQIAHLPLLELDASPKQPSLKSRQSGLLAGETCLTHSDCAVRECVRAGPVLCNGNRNDCVCALSNCTTSSDCLNGETCFGNIGKKKCLSRTSRMRVREGSLTLGACRTMNDCATDRDCFSEDNNFIQSCQTSSTKCLCYPLKTDFCNAVGSSVGCETDGEVCKQVSSKLRACTDPNYVPSASKGTPSENPNSSRGLSYDICVKDRDCTLPRTCLQSSNGELKSCDASARTCFCVPPLGKTSCKSVSDCVKGEVCMQFDPLGLVCVSKTMEDNVKESNENRKNKTENGQTPNATETKDPDLGCIIEAGESVICVGSIPDSTTLTGPTEADNGGGCIAIRELQGFSTERLVFRKHKITSVLCDRFESCATAGHMVYYNGNGMMMKSYCNLIKDGCETRRMEVNSPKWSSRRLRIRSKSPGLEYTSFAAKYETNTEEQMLKIAIRFGL